jgi:anti-anti-sigma factor
MEITTERLERCDVLKATGRIDSQTAPDLEKAFRALIDENCYKLVFDVGDVDFVSSAALRVMIDVQKTCKERGRGELLLARVPERIYKALELAGFVPLFEFFDDVSEAVARFQN